MKVYIAKIELRDEIIAISTDEKKARTLALTQAKDYLVERGAPCDKGKWTKPIIEDYFGVRVVSCEMESGTIFC